jgi:hypothetical protein
MTGTPTLDNTALDAVVAEHLAAVNACDESATTARPSSAAATTATSTGRTCRTSSS